MSNSVLSIVIKLAKEGSADKDTVEALSGVASTVGTVVGVLGAMAAAGAAVDTVLKNTIGTYVEYGNKVKDVMDMTGMTAEESSRLTVIAGDLGLSIQNLAMGFKTMAKNGIDPSIYGMTELVKQYQALPSQIEKDNFAVKEFGRSWTAFLPILSMSADELQRISDAVPNGMIFSGAQVEQTKQMAISWKILGDAWEGAKLEAMTDLMKQVAPPVSEAQQQVNSLSGSMGKLKTANIGADDSTKNWTIDLAANRKALADTTGTVQTWDDILKLAQAGVEAYDKGQGNLLDDGMKLTQQTQNYAAKLADLNMQLAAAEKITKKNSTQVQDLKDQILDLETAQKRQTEEFVLDMMKQAGIAPEAQIAYARSAGLISAAAATEASAILRTDAAMKSSGMSAEQMAAVNQKITNAMLQGGQGAEDFFTQLHTLDHQLEAGTITAQDYYHAVDQIYQDMMLLSGMSATAHLTVIITEVGGSVSGIGQELSNLNGSGPGLGTGFTGGGGSKPQAIGGDVQAGGLYYVHRDEIFVPAQSGYVMSRRDAAEVAGNMTTNSSTKKTLNIYGSVTYVIPDMGTSWLNEIV